MIDENTLGLPIAGKQSSSASTAQAEALSATQVDLLGRLSNPLEAAEIRTAQRSEPIGDSEKGIGIPRNDDPEAPTEMLREEAGRLSDPPQRRLSRTDIDQLIAAYRDGATVIQLAAEFGVHRTTVGEHLDRNGVPRHSERDAWDEGTLTDAAELCATGLSLADVANRYDIDAQTVANRFRRAGIPVRPRRGWTSRAHAEHDRR